MRFTPEGRDLETMTLDETGPVGGSAPRRRERECLVRVGNSRPPYLSNRGPGPESESGGTVVDLLVEAKGGWGGPRDMGPCPETTEERSKYPWRVDVKVS